jgi:hypothetical protein
MIEDFSYAAPDLSPWRILGLMQDLSASVLTEAGEIYCFYLSIVSKISENLSQLAFII